MPRGIQAAAAVQADQVMDLTADDATDDEESGTLQDGVLDDDDEEDAEAGTALTLLAVLPVLIYTASNFVPHSTICSFVPRLAHV